MSTIDSMRVTLAVDQTLASQPANGTGIAAMAILQELKRMAADHQIDIRLLRSPVNRNVSEPRGPLRWLKTLFLDLVWTQILLPLKAIGSDALFIPGGIAPWLSATPVILTVHDIFPITHGEHFPRWHRGWFRIMFPLGLRKVRRIIASSPETAESLVQCKLAARCPVVLQGLDASPAFANHGSKGTIAPRLPNPFILCVGTLEPRKNLPRLLEAMEIVRAQRGEIDLVHVGPPGWGRATGSGIQRHWFRPLGVVPIAELAALYREAKALAYPSLAEGFGLPLLEAVRSECPVACSSHAGFLQICGGSATGFDPLDPVEIAKSLVHVLDQGKGEEHRRARIDSTTYSWSNYALGVLQAARSLAGKESKEPD